MRRVVVLALSLTVIAVAGACPPEDHPDVCEKCTDTEQKNACIAIVRDDCEDFPEGSPDHENCEDHAADGCEGEGEGEGEGGEGEGAGQ